jgi:hypothetical protein
MNAACAENAAARDLCVLALREPAAAIGPWGMGEWNRFVPQARSASLLPRAAARLRRHADETGGRALPAPLLGHLESNARLFDAQRREIGRELGHILAALGGLDVPIVLLKGVAYLAAGLPSAEGRFFTDVDILVPKAVLGEVEASLMMHGWLTTHLNAYDQRYYRQWMHELPPMEHVHRRTTLDVHHTIVPETARMRPDAARLIADSLPLPDYPGLRVLAPRDMVLHGMAHLFLNDDMSHGLRDLSDLDLLLRHFAALDPDFWSGLVERARAMDLARLAHYGLRYCARILGTPVPRDTQDRLSAFGPSGPARALMDALWHRALASPHPTATGPGRGLALMALYLRGHWLRMPPALLMRHLSIKALRLHLGTKPDPGLAGGQPR